MDPKCYFLLLFHGLDSGPKDCRPTKWGRIISPRASVISKGTEVKLFQMNASGLEIPSDEFFSRISTKLPDWLPNKYHLCCLVRNLPKKNPMGKNLVKEKSTTS